MGGASRRRSPVDSATSPNLSEPTELGLLLQRYARVQTAPTLTSQDFPYDQTGFWETDLSAPDRARNQPVN